MNKKVLSKRGLLLLVFSLVIFLLAVWVGDSMAAIATGNDTSPAGIIGSQSSPNNPSIPSPDPGVLRAVPEPGPGGNPGPGTPPPEEIGSVSSVNVSSPNAWDVRVDDEDKSPDAVQFAKDKALKSGVYIHVRSGSDLVAPIPLLDKK